MRKLTVTFLIGLLLLSILSACSTAQSSQASESSQMQMMALDQMPAAVQSAPVTVQQAYQFAVANSDVMQQIPCYCGCGAIGHTSNYSCYVASVGAQGAITFDNHALGCSICVDITLDTMRMTNAGQSPGAIRATIDATYAKYGPSNMP